MTIAPSPPRDVPKRKRAAVRRWRLRSVEWVAIMLLIGLLGFTLLPTVFSTGDPITLSVGERLQAPSLAHPFGTDEGGRDLYSRVVYGTRNSLGVAMAVVMSAALFGVVYGAVSGLVGGYLDQILMRIVDLFLAFPAFILAIAVAAALGRGLGTVAIALAIIWWPSYARLVRAEVLTLRELPHVESARALGVRGAALARRHILPFVVRSVNVRISTDIGYALVAVTALSFLGLGAQSPTPEWGLLIRDSRTYFGSAWWYMVFPGFSIVLATVAFSVLGDLLADRRDRR